MTDERIRPTPVISDDEIGSRLSILAVRRGLRIPQTAEEVAAFEQEFSDAPADAATRRRTLAEVRARAKQLRVEGVKFRSKQPVTDEESRPQMAARNGNEIAEDVAEQMEAALKSNKLKIGDGR
jgi:hypothetical protein